VGTSAAADSAVSVVVGTVEASVVSVAEEVGEVVALAGLAVGSAASAEVFGARSIEQLEIRKAKSEQFQMIKKT
jgi:hypothetical protein